MSQITKVYRQSLPAMRFVGRCYTDKDKINNTFSHLCGEWFATGLFDPLQLPPEEQEPFDGADAFCGLFRCKDGEPNQYWIGAFLPAGADVPEGYDSIDFEACDIGVCWVYGKEPDIFFADSLSSLRENGMDWKADANGVRWCCERYACPRYTDPDAEGNVILDMCYYNTAALF